MTDRLDYFIEKLIFALNDLCYPALEAIKYARRELQNKDEADLENDRNAYDAVSDTYGSDD